LSIGQPELLKGAALMPPENMPVNKEDVRSAEFHIGTAQQGHGYEEMLNYVQHDLQAFAKTNMVNEALDQMQADYFGSNIKRTVENGRLTAIDFTGAVGNKIHCDATKQWACALDTTMGSDIIHTSTALEYAQKGRGWEFYQDSLKSALQDFDNKGLLSDALKRLQTEGDICGATTKTENGKVVAVDIETAMGNKLHFDATKHWAMTLDERLGNGLIGLATDVSTTRDTGDGNFFSRSLQSDLQKFERDGILSEALQRLRDQPFYASEVGGVYPHTVNGKITSIDFVGLKTVHCDGSKNWEVTVVDPKLKTGL
jgi:hypothetical protein